MMATPHAAMDKEEAALKCAAPASWGRMLSEASTSLPEDGAFSRQSTGSGSGSVAAAAAADEAVDCPPDDCKEADLGATASVSLALVALAAVGSLWLQPAAFPGLAALGLVMAAVVWLTDFPCGGVRGSLAAAREGLGDDDVVPDGSREEDLAATVSASLAMLAAAAVAAYGLCGPTAAAALAAVGCAVLVAAWLSGVPCGLPPLPQLGTRAGAGGEGDERPDDSEEADVAAIVSVALAITVLSALVSLWLYPAMSAGCAVLALAMLAVAWLKETSRELPKSSCDGSPDVLTASVGTGERHRQEDSSAEDSDIPPTNSKEADRAALVSVSLAVSALAAASLLGLAL